MLPKYLNIRDVDKGIRELVVRLNRLPYIVTISSCEGHVINDVDGWYLTEGEITIQSTGNTEAKKFAKRLEQFCRKYKFVSLMDGEPRTEEQINGMMTDKTFRLYGFKFPLGKEEFYIITDRVDGDEEYVKNSKRKVNEFWIELASELNTI